MRRRVRGGEKKERELNVRIRLVRMGGGGNLREKHRRTLEGEKCCNYWRENGSDAGMSVLCRRDAEL